MTAAEVPSILPLKKQMVAGAGSTEEHLLFPAEASPLPLLRVERGGEVTYHGPGQLVLYPVLNLRRHCCDLHWYMRSLEEVAVRSAAATCQWHATKLHLPIYEAASLQSCMILCCFLCCRT